MVVVVANSQIAYWILSRLCYVFYPSFLRGTEVPISSIVGCGLHLLCVPQREMLPLAPLANHRPFV